MTTEIAERNHVASASEAFQNHEERMVWLEKVASAVIGAMPHLADSLGISRPAHEFTTPEGAPLSPVLSTDTRLDNLEALLRQALAARTPIDTTARPVDEPPPPTPPPSAMGRPW